jgi:hypothetical protein
MPTIAASSDDFDFAIGNWSVTHRRLKERLANCNEWIEFPGTSETRKVLGGHGNVEDDLLELPDGTYRAVALRSFNPAENAWAIWWLDARSPWSIDAPVIGKFSNGVGLFYADGILNGKPIRIRFTWTKITADALRWEQAFSPDAGASWEPNWTMHFARRDVRAGTV